MFAKGDHVVIVKGPFEGYECIVDEVLPEKGLIRVLVPIFRRQMPMEVEGWQLRKSEEA